jgi:putative restriction endonuclease
MQGADKAIRAAAFAWLEEQVNIHGDVLPRTLLAAGFTFAGERVPLLGPQGIFKPRVMQLPLSITTVSNGPYDDTFGPDGLISYKYRGTDPAHRDNVGLRQLWKERVPLIYFHAVVPGSYVPAWPVLVVGDNPATLTFTVAVDDPLSLSKMLESSDAVSSTVESEAVIRRGYITTTVKRRIHQRAFRERVIDAYRAQCALCRLRHRELLDAAHIVADSYPHGEPVVSNGISLCKLHHAAFDKYFISVRPDYVVEVRRDVLDEKDGPMLRHGLQGIHGQRIQLPGRSSQRPDRDLLELRHKRFLDFSTASSLGN